MWCCYYYKILPYLIAINVLYLCLKIYNKLTTGVYESDEKLHGKTVIVTGANSGIGYECAKDFAKRGAKVIMACRNMKTAEKAKSTIIEETGNDNIKLKHVDFADLDSVRKCANEILSEESHIHILLNNAGISGTSTGITKDGINDLMQINHYGPFLFTNILLGKIKNSSPSRIVNVTSNFHQFGKLNVNNYKTKNSLDFFVYSNSKLGNIYFTTELAKLLEGTNVTVNCLHPGVIGTEITRTYPFLLQHLWKFGSSTFFKSIKEGSQTSIYLCVAPELANVTGKYFVDCKEGKMSKRAHDTGFAKKFWQLSEEAVKLQPDERHY